MLALILLLFILPWSCHRQLPDFSGIDDINERKAAFFSFLQPFTDEANAEILDQREHLQTLAERMEFAPLSRRDIRFVRYLAAEYGLELAEDEPPTPEILDKLLLRVDIIPPSLALAQAALESGWGTSRFAREGNNLFGIWCYEPGCGIVPKRRPAGASYEVKAYRSPRESFTDYMRNLNTNRAYESLWQLRQTARSEDRELTGVYLADGLYRYSQEGWGYVSKVQGLIRSNQLLTFDEKYQ